MKKMKIKRMAVEGKARAADAQLTPSRLAPESRHSLATPGSVLLKS